MDSWSRMDQMSTPGWVSEYPWQTIYLSDECVYVWAYWVGDGEAEEVLVSLYSRLGVYVTDG
jgi:hypothetical protein